MSTPLTLTSKDDQAIAAAVTALTEGLPRELVEEILAGMAASERLGVLDTVLAHRARVAAL